MLCISEAAEAADIVSVDGMGLGHRVYLGNFVPRVSKVEMIAQFGRTLEAVEKAHGG